MHVHLPYLNDDSFLPFTGKTSGFRDLRIIRSNNSAETLKAGGFTRFEGINGEHNFISVLRKSYVSACYGSLAYQLQEMELHPMLFDRIMMKCSFHLCRWSLSRMRRLVLTFLTNHPKTYHHLQALSWSRWVALSNRWRRRKIISTNYFKDK